jgi:hypothetical protein
MRFQKLFLPPNKGAYQVTNSQANIVGYLRWHAKKKSWCLTNIRSAQFLSAVELKQIAVECQKLNDKENK